METCCNQRIEKFKSETSNHLNRAKANLLKIRDLELTYPESLLSKKMLELIDQDGIWKAIGVDKFQNITKDFNDGLQMILKTDNDVRHHFSRVEMHRYDCYRTPLERKKELYEVKRMIGPMQEEVQRVQDKTIPEIKRHLKTITHYPQSDELKLAKKYISTNADSLKNRTENLLKIIKESSFPAVQSIETVHYTELTYTIYYFSFGFASIFATFPVLIPAILNALFKSHLLVEKISQVGFFITVFLLIVISATFTGLSLAVDFRTNESCSQKVKNEVLSNYTVRFMNTSSIINEKSFEPICNSSTDSFLQDFDISQVFAARSVLLVADFDGYKDRMITSMDTYNMPPVWISDEVKNELEELSDSIDHVLWALGSCPSWIKTEPPYFRWLETEYNKVIQKHKEFENGLKIVNDWKYLIRNMTTGAFDPIRSEIDSQTIEIVKHADFADFNCKSIVESSWSCSRPDEKQHLGFFFCFLLSVCLLLILNQFLLNPWIVEKKEKGQETGSNSAENGKAATNGTTSSPAENSQTPSNVTTSH